MLPLYLQYNSYELNIIAIRSFNKITFEILFNLLFNKIKSVKFSDILLQSPTI